MLVVTITIMNLVTAVLVEHSFSLAKNDTDLHNEEKRARVKTLLPQIEILFANIDEDSDGQISLAEAVSPRVVWPKELAAIVRDKSVLVDLYGSMDRDHSGKLDLEEFTH